MTTLVIVESPGKVKKIAGLLGAGYKVVASVGHVRDLPQKELGVEPPDFRPHYEPTERGRGTLAGLRKEVAAADRVLLATDPDREGEAISWHLADALGLKNPQRITFTAITKAAVQAAIAAPRAIDMQRVRSQEARRALDRIVGYRVSPALSNRPTHAADLEAGENDDQRALYRLIWQRAVASQLADATYAVRSVSLAGDAAGEAVTFTATGRTLTAPGWLAVYADDAADKDEGDDEASSNPIPALAEGDGLTASNGRVLTKHTKPPTRFTEPTLVAEMERLGIGRPSTYASIIENITTIRGYVIEREKGYLYPTPVGEQVRDALVSRFRFAELDYTRGLEDQLDHIAEGQADYRDVVAAAWAALDTELGALDSAAIVAAHPCPECGKPLRRRKGQYGFFWSCTGYPDCTVSMPDAKGKPGERKAPPPPTGFKCQKCGSELARRQGVSKPKAKGQKGRPYDFYGCTGYPKCDATYQTGADGKPVFDSGAASAAAE